MKNPLGAKLPLFDAAAITDTIRHALGSAGLANSTAHERGVTELVKRALTSGGLIGGASIPSREDSLFDVDIPVMGEGHSPALREASICRQRAPLGNPTHSFRNHAGSRNYKLHVPSPRPDGPLPLVVMLHGCTQSAEDFATGTQMNCLADRHGFLVVYPEQVSEANVSRCWNWFQPTHQVRGGGEPSILAGIVGDVAARHQVDPRRVFVAGLSAGAAMAVILGETYPEVFAAIGVHSGLAYGSACDLPSALAAMKGGRCRSPVAQGLTDARSQPRKNLIQAVPTIVFHGDRDHTVQSSNGAEIARQAAHAHSVASWGLDSTCQAGTAAGGKRYSRTVLTDTAGQPRIETWTVHGAGHAWSGGAATGSYTDPTGPDASAEMVRFFLAQTGGGPT